MIITDIYGVYYIVISCNVHFVTLHEILLHCRPSRLWVWFHECGEDEDST